MPLYLKGFGPERTAFLQRGGGVTEVLHAHQLLYLLESNTRDMDCPDCEIELVAFAVPPEYAEYIRGSESTVGLCPRCLSLEPVAEQPPDEPAFDRIGDAFPSSRDAGVPLALLLGLLSNLALYRSEISSLLEDVERAGTDPLLVLDRLDRDPTIETEIDLSGRRRQLEQLL